MTKRSAKTDVKNLSPFDIDRTQQKKSPTYTKFKMDEETGAVKAVWEKGEDVFYMGTHDLDVFNNTIRQIINVCARGNQFDDGCKVMANAAMATIQEIEPQDSTELMLATQMVTVHNMAMELSRRAMLSEQTFEGVEANINRANKLMRTFTAQVEALNKYRTKGQQKITVQHVNVNDGGQAIVGDVKGGG